MFLELKSHINPLKGLLLKCITQFLNKFLNNKLLFFVQVLSTFPDLDLSSKLVIVPPGMDPNVFNLCTSIESNTEAFLKQVITYCILFLCVISVGFCLIDI